MRPHQASKTECCRCRSETTKGLSCERKIGRRRGTPPRLPFGPRIWAWELHPAVRDSAVASLWVELLELLTMDTSSPRIHLLPRPCFSAAPLLGCKPSASF
ncbi:uncharacterized protein LOC100273312 [Zea mays]|uniref:Uncharacterized protein n=1 Tax=Zea mays TaxID=4577 RepID=B4FUH3_MAIZE|nr:uncharacterized protein LOC100273312 [Zea mays]ACF85766.1 unknown [Zea mays]|eukprot:NP_001141225.1 uncharacterized protein LOC100273312 [Zea mays]